MSTKKNTDDIFIDIVKEKNKNRILVFASIAFFSVVTLGALAFAYKVQDESKENIYSITDEGSVSNLERVKLITALPDEVRFQLHYLFSSYYTLDYTTLDSRKLILDLFDEQDAFKLEAKWEGWFNNMRSQSLSQSATLIEESIKIRQVKDNHFDILAKAVFSVDNAGFQNIYELTINTRVKRTKRKYPLNPHGFIFYNYSDEIVLQKENVEI